MADTEKYMIKVERKLVEVSPEVYYAYFRMERQERGQEEKKQRNNVMSYDALDTTGTVGAETFPDLIAPSMEDVTLTNEINARLHHEAMDPREYETQRMRRIFQKEEPRSELDANLIAENISAVMVDSNGNVKIRLKNDQIILKEVSKLSDPKRIVTLIPAKPLAERQAMKRQLRVAAYCRVSTEEEEQQSSYEAQCTYYTDKIMRNPEWNMAGVFADEGISGTSTKKRDNFNRMIRRCKAKKIDLILTKSISRFARNTLDTINYTRMLRAMGIGVIFEKENINTLDMDSEMLITMLGAFAQAESESLSRNVAWGKRQAIREGKVHVNFNRLYGYTLREDGTPAIDSEKADVVRLIFERYVAGDSLRIITYRLNNAGILNPSGEPEWKSATIRSILMNEKYCGDVLGQKTFKEGVIGGKVQKNTGQLPQVLIQNNHPAIISRELFYAVQEETKRRTAAKSPSTKSPTGRSSYTSKYALSERLVCGECGTLYRRCTWNGKEQKRIVWRCVSRLDYGKKYCHNSPTMDEVPLQKAIMAAVNTRMPPNQDIRRASPTP